MLKNSEIIDKAEWLEGQYRKNLDLLEVIVQEGFEKCNSLKPIELAKEYIERIKECVLEYRRLASDYIEYKARVEKTIKDSLNILTDKEQECEK